MYYHVWFITKYRKKILYGEVEKNIRVTVREIVLRKKYRILRVAMGFDHLHLLLEAKNRKCLADMMRVIKAVTSWKLRKSGLYIGRKAHLWARRYGYREILSSVDLETVRSYLERHQM